jgi:Protein of unknown function (DUF2628)
MTVYMVFEPPGGDPATRAERIVFLADRFSWGAFLLGPLWMLWRRLWLAFCAYIVVIGAVTVGLRFAGAGLGARILIVVLIALLVGFEAANLRRRKLRRGGWHEVGAVIGADRESAERRFFEAYVVARKGALAGASAASPSQRPAASGGDTDVIGLFPQPGANR